jgi:DNA-binding transcriptional LysR family regulator
MSISLRQLRAFVAVAEAGSFSAAAIKLHLTSSALSLLIREMERILNVRVFDRTTRQTVLSQAGVEFYPLAKKVLDDLARAVESTKDLELKKRGTIRVACSPLYSTALLPELLSHYREQYPAIAVNILDSTYQSAMSRVMSGEADIAIMPHRISPPELVQERLFTERIVFICRSDHPLASRQHVTWDQVLKEAIVSVAHEYTTRLQVDLLKYSAKLVLNPQHSVSFVTTALGMVQWKHGVTALPESVISLLPPYGLVARPIKRPSVNRDISLFYKRGIRLTPAALSFREFLSQQSLGNRRIEELS